MAARILSLVEDELYMDFRYLDSSLAALEPVCRRELVTMATDGIHLFYSPDQLLRVFPSTPVFLNHWGDTIRTAFLFSSSGSMAASVTACDRD